MDWVPAAARLRLRQRAGALFGVSCLCCAGVLACGSSAPDSGVARWARLGSALSGATIERGESGALALITVTPEEVGLCTATLLTPNLVATARHCVAPSSADSVRCDQSRGSFSAPYAADTLWVNHASALSDGLASFGLLPIRGGSDEFVSVADVFVPDTKDVCGGDLALLVLSRELDAGEAAPFAPRLDVAVQRGDAYTAVGFGDTPAESGQGVRRSRAGLEVSCTPQDCDTVGGIETTEFQGGDGVCFGDSGGPALDAEDRVVGIASRSDNCTGSVYSAVSAWRDFIREVAARAVRAGRYPAPPWLVPAPPAPEPPEPAPASDTPVAAAPPEASPEPEPEPPLAESPSGASDIERRPVAASEAGGGCSVSGASSQRRPPCLPWLGFGLCALALRQGSHRKRTT